METVECDNCGDTKQVYPSNNSDNNFCDRECLIEHRQSGMWSLEYDELKDADWIRHRHHDLGMTYREIAEELGCSHSNVHKRAQQHGIEPQRERYVKLADPKWLREHNHEKELRLYEIANLIGCTRSAVGFAMKRHGLEIRRHHAKGEDSPFWEEGYDRYYGANWQETREKARERDNYCCQDCGIGEEELGVGLHVHHIRPIKEYDDVEDANTLDNLVSLCQPCHNKWEGIQLKPDNR